MFDQTWAMPIKLQQFVCCKFGIVELISIYVCACVSFTLNFHSWTCKHWTKLTTDRSMIVANLIDFYWCIISKSCVYGFPSSVQDLVALSVTSNRQSDDKPLWKIVHGFLMNRHSNYAKYWVGAVGERGTFRSNVKLNSRNLMHF